MFSENNITTKYLSDLAHCTTQLIDLTPRNISKSGVKTSGMYKSDICDTKQEISLKRRAKLTTGCL